jgi:chromosome segregation ATPase
MHSFIMHSFIHSSFELRTRHFVASFPFSILSSVVLRLTEGSTTYGRHAKDLNVDKRASQSIADWRFQLCMRIFRSYFLSYSYLYKYMKFWRVELLTKKAIGCGTFYHINHFNKQEKLQKRQLRFSNTMEAMASSLKTKIVVFVLAAGRWYTGGFGIPIAAVTIFHLVAWRIKQSRERQRLQNVPLSALAAVRARKKTAAEIDDDDISKAPSITMGNRRSIEGKGDDKSVGSVYSQNRFSRPQTLRQRQRASEDDAHSVGSRHTSRPKFIRASKAAHHDADADEVSVLSFTSNALGRSGNKTKKIRFSQHEEIVELLNAKLEGALEQHNKMRSILEVQNQELAKVAHAYDAEKRKNINSQESATDGSALHDLFDKQAMLEIEHQKVQNLERSEAELQRAFEEAQQKIQELESSQASSHESHNAKELFEIQNQRIETLQDTQNELDELLQQERDKVSNYERERAVSRRETMKLPWEESKAPKEEILVKKNMEIKSLEQTSNHARLRQIKSQKMWQLEKERASVMEQELAYLNEQVDKEKTKVRSLEQNQREIMSTTTRSKVEMAKVQQAHEETKSYLKAEKQKVANLQKSNKESLELLKEDQGKTSSLQKQAATFGESQNKVKKLQANIQKNENMISSQKDLILDLEKSLADEQTKHSHHDKIFAATKASNLHLTLGQARIKVNELELRLQEKEKLYQQEQQRAADKENLFNVVKSSLEIEETKRNALEEERTELTNMLQEERSNNSNKERALTSHETSISSLENRFKKLEADRSETQSMLDAERNKCRDLDYEIRALNDHIRTKESEIEMVERRLQDSTSTLEFTNKKLKDSEDDREQILRSQKAKIQNYMEEQNRLRNTNNVDQSRMSNLEKSVMEKDLELDGERKNNGILTQEHGIVKRKLETEEEKNRSLEMKQVEMKNGLQESERQARLLEAELEDKRKECATEKARCEELLVEQAKLKESLQSTQRKSMELESQKNKLTSLLEAEKNRAGVFERLVEQKDNSISMKLGQTEELYTKMATLEKDVAEKETLLKYEKETLELLEHSLAETEKDLASEKKKVVGFGKEIDELTARLNEANGQQESFVKTLQEKDSLTAVNQKTIEMLQNEKCKAEKMQTELNLLNVEHESKKLSVSKMQETLNEKESEITTLTKQVKDQQEIEATIAEQAAEIEELRQLATESIAVARKEQEISALQKSLESEQSKLKMLEQKQEHLGLAKAEKEKAIASLEGSLKTKDTKISQKEDAIKSLEKSLSSEQSKLKTLTDQHQKCEVEQSGARQQIKEVTTSLEKKETILSAKQDEINTLEKKLDDTKSDHETLLKQKEAAIAVLQKAVTNDKANFEKNHEQLIEGVKTSEEKIQYLEQSLDDKLIMVAQLQQGVSVLEDELKDTKQYYEHLVAPEEIRKMGMKLREMLTATHQLNEISTKATAHEAVAKEREELSRSGVSDLRNLLLATSVFNGANHKN